MDMVLTGRVLDAATDVHRRIGPGLLESAYQHCLAYELSRNGIEFQRQVPVPIHYDDVTLDVGYRLDFLVESSLVVEIKSVESLQPIHTAQLLSYLKLSQKPLGLLLNFNVTLLKFGIRRLINTPPEQPPRPQRPLR